MSEKVNMEVECVSNLCKQCPELELTVDKMNLSNGEISCNLNSIRCVHLEKCRDIYYLMKMDWETNRVRKI